MRVLCPKDDHICMGKFCTYILNGCTMYKRIVQLETCIKSVLADSESGTHWGPDITVCEKLRTILEG